MDKFDIAFWISFIGSWCFAPFQSMLKNGLAKDLCILGRGIFLGAATGSLIGSFFN